ncbi:beta-ketoacyl-[acyl-carrier-protein] synthase family protein [Isoptericola jiangsuensis]|uniref:beta-ketoacyl-[acyl-carrier-protein] synthase family protein n=1 Tax=Isoptericola jiangsuensis TaxID=548579 RepID=UPI003AAEEC5D
MVTGIGAVTPLGLTAAETWRSLRDGRNGVGLLEEPWSAGLSVNVAARVDDAFLEALPVRERRRTDRVAQLTLVAGRAAWADAGSPDVEPERLGVAVGTANGGYGTTLAQHALLDGGGQRAVSPHAVTMVMANSPAAWLSIDLKAKAGARAPVTACAAGSEAIGMGRQAILADEADVVVCGGVEASVLDLVVAAFSRARAMSTRSTEDDDDPTTASRPFDASRDGFVMGEGSVMVVLEEESHARARGATVLGAVDGFSLTSDAHDIVGGEHVNQARTIRLALRSAGLMPSDVGLVHAHATSTPAGDLNEARALSTVGVTAPVTATKASTGHLLGGSGPLGVLAALGAMRDGVVPATLHTSALDPQVDLDLVTAARPTTARHALVDAFGFGGHSSALVVSAP